MKYFTGISTQLGQRISVLSDLLASKQDPPRVWYNQNVVMPTKFLENFRFSVLEVQEHLETYFDRKDHVMECLETVRTSCKIALFSDTESNHDRNTGGAILVTSNSDVIEYLIDLGRALYKLMFQLLLLIESDHKIAVSVVQHLRQHEKLMDWSQTYMDIRGALLRCIDDAELDSLDTSTSTEGDNTPTASPGLPLSNAEFETTMIDLIDNQKWTVAVTMLKQHKQMYQMTSSNLSLNFGASSCLTGTIQFDQSTLNEDLSYILSAYSQKLIKDKTGKRFNFIIILFII